MTKVDWAQVNLEILSGLDLRDTYAQLGVEITGQAPSESGWIEARAYGRDDRTPSAAVNVRTGTYKDHGGDGVAAGIYEMAVRVGKFTDWKEARKHYAKVVGVTLPRGRPPTNPIDHLEFKPWCHNLVDMWGQTKLPINANAVLAAGGRLAVYRQSNHVVTVPVIGPMGLDAEPCGWVMWERTGGTLPVFHAKGISTRKKMKTTAGSQPGLIGLHAWQKTAIDSGTDPATQTIWKTEGPVDMLALLSMIPDELRDTHLAITNANGASEIPKAGMSGPFTGRRVMVVHDADVAGEAGAVDKWVPWLTGVASEVRHIRLPYEVAPLHGKDLRDYFNDGHTFEELLTLAMAVEPAKPVTVSQAVHKLEADDDPHRLARLYLERYCKHDTDGYTLRHWKGCWRTWKKKYECDDDQIIRGVLTREIKEEFDRIHRDVMANAADGNLPEVRKVVQGVVLNAVNALMGDVILKDSDLELNRWINPLLER